MAILLSPSLSLLQDPVFSVNWRERSTALTLPGLFAALAVDDGALTLARARPHQLPIVRVFFAQLAAAALLRLPDPRTPPTDEAGWRNALEQLGSEHPTVWDLFAQDFATPAFMQPAVAASIPRTAFVPSPGASPDMLDVLVTAKNHDVKRQTSVAAQADQWMYALVVQQTSDGYSGRGNYGIARMNAGLGSRVVCGLYSGDFLAAMWRDDVQRIVESLDGKQPLPCQYDLSGPLFVSALPWDGKASLPLAGLHPLFIDCARLLRVTLDDGVPTLWRCATEVARVAAAELKGAVGDPWTPVRVKDGATLTLSAIGFYPELVNGLLTEADFRRPVTMTAPDKGAVHTLVLEGLCRGQGKTQGFHDYRATIPGAMSLRLFGRKPDVDLRRMFAGRSRMFLDHAGQLVRHARSALAALTARDGNLADTVVVAKHAQKLRGSYNEYVRAHALNSCLASLDEPADDRALAAWRAELARWLRTWFRHHLPAMTGTRNRYLGAARVESRFETLLRQP